MSNRRFLHASWSGPMPKPCDEHAVAKTGQPDKLTDTTVAPRFTYARKS